MKSLQSMGKKGGSYLPYSVFYPSPTLWDTCFYTPEQPHDDIGIRGCRKGRYEVLGVQG